MLEKVVLIALFIFSQNLSAAQIKGDKEGIIALGEEMTTLKYMLGVFGLIGTDVTYKAPKKRLKQEIKDYEEKLSLIEKEFASNKEVLNKIKESSKAWLAVKSDLQEAFKQQSSQKELESKAISIHSRVKSAINKLEEVKELILKDTKLSNMKELNASIEIATNISDINAHYIMSMWGLKDPTIKEHWNQALSSYQKHLKILENSKFAKDKDIAPLLKTVKKEYEFFKFVTLMSKDGKYTPALIQEHSDKAREAALKMIELILVSKN